MGPPTKTTAVSSVVLMLATVALAQHEGFNVAPPAIHSGVVNFRRDQYRYLRQAYDPGQQQYAQSPQQSYQVSGSVGAQQQQQYGGSYAQANQYVQQQQLQPPPAPLSPFLPQQQLQQSQQHLGSYALSGSQQQFQGGFYPQQQPQQQQQYQQPPQQQYAAPVQQQQFYQQPQVSPAAQNPFYGQQPQQQQLQQSYVQQQPQQLQQQQYQPLPVAQPPQQFQQQQQQYPQPQLQQLQQPQQTYVQQPQQYQAQPQFAAPVQQLQQQRPAAVIAPPPLTQQLPVAVARPAPPPQQLLRAQPLATAPPPPARFTPRIADVRDPAAAVAATATPRLAPAPFETVTIVTVDTHTEQVADVAHTRAEARVKTLRHKKKRVKVLPTSVQTVTVAAPPPRPIHRVVTTTFPPSITPFSRQPQQQRVRPSTLPPAAPPPQVVTHPARVHKPTARPSKLVELTTAAAASAEGRDPNDVFLQCCRNTGIDAKCHSRCNFDTLTKKVLTGMFLGTDPCPQKNGRNMLGCAAENRDHTQCCLERGVHTTAAKNKCLGFCVMTPGSTFQADISMLPCWAVLNDIKGCFKDAILDE